MAGWRIRDAVPDELAAVFDVFYEHAFHDQRDPPPARIPEYLGHVARTGRIVVADDAGRISGFAGLITRGEVSFLTDLFVRPSAQSASIGRALLGAILPAEGVRCTCSTADPRALSLYIRAGMRPWWPQFWLRGAAMPPERFAPLDIETVVGPPDDPALVAWEHELGGRPRTEDFAFWATEQQGVPLWFRRGGATIGYAIVRLGCGTLRIPDAATVGPVGARRATDAASCVLAALAWADARTNTLYLTVPGPHPALAPLLGLGFWIDEAYSFVSSGDAPCYDPQHYISSGADLF